MLELCYLYLICGKCSAETKTIAAISALGSLLIRLNSNLLPMGPVPFISMAYMMLLKQDTACRLYIVFLPCAWLLPIMWHALSIVLINVCAAKAYFLFKEEELLYTKSYMIVTVCFSSAYIAWRFFGLEAPILTVGLLHADYLRGILLDREDFRSNLWNTELQPNW